MSHSSQRPPSLPPSLPGLLHHLLQGGLAELQGNVVELGATLSAEVAKHIGVPVRLLQQLHLSLNQAEALSEEPLHSHCPSFKLSSERWSGGGGSKRADKEKSRDPSPHLGPVLTSGTHHHIWDPSPHLGLWKDVCPLVAVKRAASDRAASPAPPATHRKTKVPPAPRPRTSLGLKEIFPTTVGCPATGKGDIVLLVISAHSHPPSCSPDPPTILTILQTSTLLCWVCFSG